MCWLNELMIHTNIELKKQHWVFVYCRTELINPSIMLTINVSVIQMLFVRQIPYGGVNFEGIFFLDLPLVLHTMTYK